ncbi:hypothetical protein D9613_010743 [Agrocybe pediades]|uniref:Uncharacterized protein n=1 Tax=Agrocybe pediades TaxID=84607 RepID=A0A8H4QLQ3_9AGAR|nr:hypothetical protein D9613_010743 [Agrocybe pediades]
MGNTSLSKSFYTNIPQYNMFPLLSVIGFAFDMASASGCINKSVVYTIDLHPSNGGPVIQMRTLKCLDNNNSTQTRNAREEEKRDSFNLLEERTDSRCTASVCYCGIGCVFNGCMPVSQPIRSSDCNSIISSLAALPGTFSIQAGDGIGFAFESCEYTLFSTPETQYCFSDMRVQFMSTVHGEGIIPRLSKMERTLLSLAYPSLWGKLIHISKSQSVTWTGKLLERSNASHSLWLECDINLDCDGRHQSDGRAVKSSDEVEVTTVTMIPNKAAQ